MSGALRIVSLGKGAVLRQLSMSTTSRKSKMVTFVFVAWHELRT